MSFLLAGKNSDDKVEGGASLAVVEHDNYGEREDMYTDVRAKVVLRVRLFCSEFCLLARIRMTGGRVHFSLAAALPSLLAPTRAPASSLKFESNPSRR